MTTALLAWELGGGLGHASQLARLANALQSAGHCVLVALRELPRAVGLLDGGDVMLLQSPHKPAIAHAPIATPRTFAHVLWNAGFGDPAELQILTAAWSNLLDCVKPDLIVFDHAPTALLAARGRQVRRVVIGNGFCCPPDCSPLPDLRPWMPPESAQLRQAEQHVLDCMNQVLERRHAAPLERVMQLYGQVDDTFLTTLAEFDHYQERQNALTPCPSPGGRGEQTEVRYRGPWSLSGGEPPVWPGGNGKRTYAYLSPFPGLPKILDALRRAGCPTIIFGAFDPQLRDRFAATHLHFETRRLDLQAVAAQCDLAVLAGGQATTLAVLLAGKPILQVPIYLEQAINAMATVRVGAGPIAFPRGVDRTGEQIAELLGSPRYTDAARLFAAGYAGFSAEVEIAAAVERLNELAVSPGGAPSIPSSASVSFTVGDGAHDRGKK